MFYLETARLLLVQTPFEVLENRLQQDSFVAEIALPTGAITVTFPPEWPGDALVLFPLMIEQYRNAPADLAWGGTLIDRSELVAVGQIGCKGFPENGSIEIGYNVNPAYHRRGYATEMVSALVTWLFRQPMVDRVSAECRVDNIGSSRVLKRTGFVRIGERFDLEDGDLYVWEHRG
ncbi:MAG: GNAT family N-acetyltransferase [Oscillochloris sp.]|nr:GNAT family N-acetyltransferase [Oscillochloris sp.]